MDDRPSALLAGAGAGLCLATGVLLALYARGAAPDIGTQIGLLFGLFFMGFGAVLFVDFAVRGVWAIMGAAHQWAHRDDPPPVEPDEEPDPVVNIPDAIDRLERRRLQEVAHWQVFYRRLFAAGTAYGWDRGTLTGRTSAGRVMSQGAWNMGTEALAAAGAIYKDQTGTRALVAEADWNAERMWEKVPCPAGRPPDILPPPYTTTQPTTGKTTANQPIFEDQVRV